TMPDALIARGELSGRLDESRMRALNRRVEVDGTPVSTVARDALAALGLTVHAFAARAPSQAASRTGIWIYLRDQRAVIGRLAARHIELVAVSLLIAIVIALPLGLLLERAAAGAEAFIRSVGLRQTLPGIAL